MNTMKSYKWKTNQTKPIQKDIQPRRTTILRTKSASVSLPPFLTASSYPPIRTLLVKI